MNDPANENGSDDAGVSWRIRQPEDQGLVGMDGPIFFELVDGLGSTLASVSMLPETLDQLLQPHVSILAELQLDGSVRLETEFFALFPSSKSTDIYELVKDGIAPEMLEDELDVKNRLTILRKRLTDALALVDQTLATLDKDQS